MSTLDALWRFDGRGDETVPIRIGLLVELALAADYVRTVANMVTEDDDPASTSYLLGCALSARDNALLLMDGIVLDGDEDEGVITAPEVQP